MENTLFVTNVILAAGFGTRMKSSMPKVLHNVAGRAMIDWAVRATDRISDRSVVVVGHGKELVQELLGDLVEYVVQDDLLGTGHAVHQAADLLQGIQVQYWLPMVICLYYGARHWRSSLLYFMTNDLLLTLRSLC